VSNHSNYTPNRSTNASPKGEKIYFTPWWSKKPIVSGTIRNSVFTRTIKPEHVLHSPPAITLAIDVYKQLQGKVSHIVIKVKGEKTEYSCTFQQFAERSFPIQRGKAEKQLALPLQFWIRTDKSKKGKTKPVPTYERPRTKQLPMFGDTVRFDDLGNYRR
jgi:hypothetical protein